MYLLSDHQFFYWNSSIHDQVQSVNIADIFRSEYSDCSKPLDAKLLKPPSPTLYTEISFGTLFALFGSFYLMYGLLLTLLKQFINGDFRSASNGKRFQHIGCFHLEDFIISPNKITWPVMIQSLPLVEITAFRLECNSCKGFFKIDFPPMIAL